MERERERERHVERLGQKDRERDWGICAGSSASTGGRERGSWTEKRQTCVCVCVWVCVCVRESFLGVLVIYDVSQRGIYLVEDVNLSSLSLSFSMGVFTEMERIA